jgi:hypothetical protein
MTHQFEPAKQNFVIASRPAFVAIQCKTH